MHDGDAWLGARAFYVALVAAAWIILFAFERIAPLRTPRSPLMQRLLVNFCLSALALATAYAIVVPAVSHVLTQISRQGMGLLQWIQLPEAIAIVTGFALMDLTFYYWHMANHRLPWLWRFHNVHHIDPDLDVSSAFRFHFGEVALSTLFRVAQIALIGVTPFTLAIYEIVFQLNTLFQHSNVRIPITLERWLNVLIVTPRMHGIHHSDVQRENGSNFSSVLSVWDRLHRTLRLNIPQSWIAIGIPAYFDSANNTVGTTITLPFRRQRDYWQRADGRLPQRTDGDPREAVTKMEA